VLSCIPVSCLPKPKIALSVIERVVVDGPHALDPSSDSETEFDDLEVRKASSRLFSFSFWYVLHEYVADVAQLALRASPFTRAVRIVWRWGLLCVCACACALSLYGS
jgi:hypothetical protein